MLIATGKCHSESELITTFKKLMQIRGIIIEVQGFEVAVTYQPKETDSSRETEITVARIRDTMDTLRTYGFFTF